MSSDLNNENFDIPVDDVVLTADMMVPEQARGMVLFAHGSGSSRHSPRNQFVASVLQGAGLGTVLADLLTIDEEQVDASTGEIRFDIGLLASRVVALADWLVEQSTADKLHLGLFGASTGAAAALVAAAERPKTVMAVVSRGGRPDLAGDHLRVVTQPTLLIVGGLDHVVVKLNRKAVDQFTGETHLEIVAGASHLFEEPGTLEQVARLARDWFTRHLGRKS